MTDRGSRSFAQRLAILGLLLAAWGLLLYQLDAIPPGFQHDQTFNTLDALDVLSGRFQLYFPANFGREPLGIYLSAISIGLSSNIVWGLRFGTVMAGMLALPVTFCLSRRYLRYGGALLATALLAGSFWFIFAARLGLEPMLVVPLAAAMLYLLNRGMERGSSADLALAGLAGAAAVYSYPAGRALFAMAPLLLLHELVVGWWAGRRQAQPDGVQPRRMAGALTLSWGVMLTACAPLLWYVRAHPLSADRRLEELGQPLSAAMRGDFAPVAGKIAEAASSIVWMGSQAIPYHYNLPGRAALQPVLTALFLIGLGITIGAWLQGNLRQKAAEFLLLAGLLMGMAPVFLTGADALHMRGVVALPLLYLLTARGAEGVARMTLRAVSREPHGRAARWATGVLFAAGLGLVAYQWADSGQDYFVRWAVAEPTQRVYNADWRAAARALTVSPSVEPAFIGTDRLLDLDRETYLLYGPVRRDARWFYLPGNPPFPRAGAARYLLPGETDLPPALALLADRAATDETLAGPGGNYALLRDLRLTSNAVDALLDEREVRAPDAVPNYGNALRLTGAGAQDDGARIDIMTEWETLGPWPFPPPAGEAPTPPKLAVSLYDTEDYRWAQADIAAAMPYRTWQAGDRLLEALDLPLPGDIPQGKYALRMAVYDDRGGTLPVWLDNTVAASDPIIHTVQLTSGTVRDVAPIPPYPVEALGGEVLKPLGRWEPLEQLISGAPANLHVSWQAGGSPLDTANLRFQLRASGPDGQLLWEQAADPVYPPPEIWPAEQTYRLTHRIMPLTLEAGQTTATLELCAELRGEATACALVGQPQVINRPPVNTLPAPPKEQSGATWGTMLTLAGYDVARTDTSVTLTLYWQVAAPPSTELRRFVHAVDASGVIQAQSDATPDNGEIPITAWRPGEYVTDTVTLTMPAGAQAVELRAGWYDPETGIRVPVSAVDGAALPEGFLGIPIP